MIAPYRRLVPARRSRQPPPGLGLAGHGEHELAVIVLLGQPQLGDAEKPVQQRGVAGGTVGEEAETGGLQRHRSPSVHTRPTDGRPCREP